ncbi:MAG: ATP-binding protein, partial [Desulfobacterales bacterium]|nr:ATP-binding protein [Desulfobacterales bacterium]
PGGAIRLTFGTQNSDVSVRISDTGCGIPDEDLPFIFDRFYQRKKAPKDKAGYSGLGLAITKRILELHNRTIRVKSSPQKGTRFSFLLPASRSA